MLTRLTYAGIVSVRTLPYTGRERISFHHYREGPHFCEQNSCVNQAEEV